MAVLHLMDKFWIDSDFDELKATLMGNMNDALTHFKLFSNEWMIITILSENLGLNFSFSNIKYLDIAPPAPYTEFRRCSFVWSRRSQIPTALFRDTVMDIDVLLIQYVTLKEYNTEETRSRLFAPVSVISFL